MDEMYKPSWRSNSVQSCVIAMKPSEAACCLTVCLTKVTRSGVEVHTGQFEG